jgi:hypothetical protein
MDDRDGPPWVPIPERLDRPLRLGPFASGRDLLKFVTAAALASVVGLAVAPWAGILLLALGAVVALWRPDGEPLDERLASLARWTVRRTRTEVAVSRPAASPGPGGSRSVFAAADGRSVAIVRVGGVPLSFLPPADLARQFDLYRSLLRSLPFPISIHACAAPIFAGAVAPPDARGTEPERGPRAGYDGLVRLIARRRAVRRVHVALHAADRTPDGRARLETAVSLLCDRLRELGASAERLQDRALREAAWRIGVLGEEGAG